MTLAEDFKEALASSHLHTDAGESSDGFRRWGSSSRYNWEAYRQAQLALPEGSISDSTVDSRDGGRQRHIWMLFSDRSVYSCDVWADGFHEETSVQTKTYAEFLREMRGY